MSLGEMQSVLARLYVDGAFLESFCAGPDPALATYNLTPREAAALAGIDRDAIKKYAASLRSKTRGRFEHAYRLLLTLAPAAFTELYRRFYQLRLIRPYETFYGPTIELGRFLESSFTGNPEVPPYAAELARYQRLFHQARFEPRARAASQGKPPAPAPPAPPEVNELADQTRLGISSGVRSERFQYDMAVLEEVLRKGEIPHDIQPAECRVVFQSFPEVGRARKFQVSESTARLLSLCDGTRELREIVESLEADRGAVLAGAAKLLRLGLLQEVTPA